MHKTISFLRVAYHVRSLVVTCICNPTTWEMEVGGPKIHLWMHRVGGQSQIHQCIHTTTTTINNNKTHMWPTVNHQQERVHLTPTSDLFPVIVTPCRMANAKINALNVAER